MPTSGCWTSVELDDVVVASVLDILVDGSVAYKMTRGVVKLRCEENEEGSAAALRLLFNQKSIGRSSLIESMIRAVCICTTYV